MKTPTLDGQTVSYVYDVNSNLTGKSRPNGVVCNTSFDALNRPERLEYAQGMGAPFFSEDYVYVKSGNLRQVKTTATGSPVKVLRYEYDDLYQFTKVEKKNGSVFDVDESYAYNEHGLPMPGSGASSGTFSPKTYQGGLSVNGVWRQLLFPTDDN